MTFRELFRREPKSKLQRAIDRSHRRLLRREESETRRLRAAHLSAIRRINADLDVAAKALAKLDPKANRAGVFQVARLDALLTQLRDEVDAFAELAKGVTDAAIVASAAAGAGDSVEILELSIGSSFKRLSAEAIQAAVEATSAGSPLRDLFLGWGREAAIRAERRLTDAIAAGDNPRQLARALRREFGPSSIPLHRALNIARTESLRAYRTASLANYKANSDVVTGWRWLATLSIRTCGACLAMHGRKFKVDEPFRSHPSCRCRPVPFVESAAVQPDLGDAEAWLKARSRKDQDRVLGPAKARLWRRKRIELGDLVEVRSDPKWGESVREASLTSLLRRGVIQPSDLTD